MKETKKNLIRDVTKKIDKLPENKKNYILGVMNGLLISCEGTQREKEDADKQTA